MHRTGLVLFIVVSLLLINVAAEKTFKSSGNGYQVILSEETEELADGNTLVTGKYRSLWVAEEFDPNSPLAHKGMCNGHSSIIRNPDGVTWSGAGSNHCFDEDGDSFWESWEGNQNEGTHLQFRGTGKYRGLKGKGTWKSGIQFVNGTSLHTWAVTQTVP